MFKIEARTTVQELSKALNDVGRKQLPFAMALTSSRLAVRVKRGVLSVMRKRLHNPTKTTMSSLYTKMATKRSQEARVWFKDAWFSGVPADAFLQQPTQGGKRKHKRFEKALIARGLMKPSQYAIATPALMDSHGNVKGSTVMKILSGLGAAETTLGAQANATRSRRSRRKGNADRFFVADIDGTAGVWERRRTAFGEGVRPVFVFTDEAPRYRVIVPFFKIAENMVKANYSYEFAQALDFALKTAKK